MRKQARSSLALIIPALNEAPVIARTLAAVPKHLFAAVIVADNGSTDDTAETARRAGATVVREPEKGYGAACLKAIDALPEGVDIVIFMQADLSEDPAEAAALAAPIIDGRADMVLGSRVLGEAEKGAVLPHQHFGNLIATTLIRWIYGHRYSDLGPFRAIRLDALKRLAMRDRNYGWTVEMQVKALQKGLRVMEIPVSYGLRKAGVNKVSGNWKASLAAGFKILWTLARLAVTSPR
ncbi:MAG: glycosyltransferase family 2 protein [Acidimicrobiia bacterium]|nr:glycosyltransferase family 2 protein [Acidimicrobiia bacterium]